MSVIATWVDSLIRAQQQRPYTDRRNRACHSVHNHVITFDTGKGAHRLLLEVRRAGWFVPPEDDLIQLSLGNADSFEFGRRVRSQLPSVIALLRDKPYTRRALLQFTDYTYAGSETDFVPVLISGTFRVVNDELTLTVHVRSMDLLLALPISYFQMSALLEHVAREVGHTAGQVTFFMNSAHVFGDYAEQIADLRRRYKNLKKPELRQPQYG